MCTFTYQSISQSINRLSTFSFAFVNLPLFFVRSFFFPYFRRCFATFPDIRIRHDVFLSSVQLEAVNNFSTQHFCISRRSVSYRIVLRWRRSFVVVVVACFDFKNIFHVVAFSFILPLSRAINPSCCLFQFLTLIQLNKI